MTNVTPAEVFLKKWLHADETAVRVHISHNDLDGYGCNIVLGWAIDCVDDRRKTDIIRNIDAGNENFAKTVSEVISDKDTVYHVLVTDLSVDPRPLMALQEEGYHVEFVILDHHKSSLQYKEISGESLYVNLDVSATELLFTTVVPYLREVNEGNVKEAAPAYAIYGDYLGCEISMTRYAETVTKFDLGRFGPWYGLDYNKEVDNSIKEQCLFAYANNVEHNINQYLECRRRSLTLFGNGSMLSHAHARDYFNKLQSEYDEFSKDLVARYCNIPHLDIVPNISTFPCKMMSFPTIEVYVHSNGKPINDFTLISKEWTSRHPDVYMLVYVNMQRRAVELRSGPDGADCAKIAMCNGGGGHKHAAGFPLK